MKKLFIPALILSTGIGIVLTILLSTGVLSASSSVGTDDFIVSIDGRLAGSSDNWTSDLNVVAGSEVELRLRYANIGTNMQLGVCVWAQLPESLKYIEGTTILQNSDYLEGALIVEDTIANEGLNIGGYAGSVDNNPGAAATIYLTVKVPEDLPTATSFSPMIKVSTSGKTNTASSAITIVEETDPTRGFAQQQRPAV